MSKFLLLILTIVIVSFIFPQNIYAQTSSKKSYFDLIKQQMIQLTNGNVSTITITPLQKPRTTISLPTPTLYTKATITPTPVQGTQIPTKTIASTPSPMQTPTTTPKITSSVSQNPTPVPTKITTPNIDQLTFIMNEINNYRASQGLSSVQTNDETCNFATIRALELINDFSHDGFTNRINNKTLPYTTWSKVTENIAMTSDYKQVVTLWKNSSGHAANMRADTPFVCVRNNGSNYAYEGMKP